MSALYYLEETTDLISESGQITSYGPYSRVNFFIEQLEKFQVKQIPNIPENVFADIVNELNKNHITNLDSVDDIKIKTILKTLGYSCYYEYTTYITGKLNNTPPPKISQEMEKKIISMYVKIQEPWEIYKHPGRKNFLPHNYVLYKFCELLELDHLIDYLPLHKNPDKLLEFDQLWEKICSHLKWKYIKTKY